MIPYWSDVWSSINYYLLLLLVDFRLEVLGGYYQVLVMLFCLCLSFCSYFSCYACFDKLLSFFVKLLVIVLCTIVSLLSGLLVLLVFCLLVFCVF